MSAEWICDGCGRREVGLAGFNGWRKPVHWYEKTIFENEGDSIQVRLSDRVQTILSACSRRCIETAAAKAGTHSLVLPV